jgi:hypothetical protein
MELVKETNQEYIDRHTKIIAGIETEADKLAHYFNHECHPAPDEILQLKLRYNLSWSALRTIFTKGVKYDD